MDGGGGAVFYRGVPCGVYTFFLLLEESSGFRSAFLFLFGGGALARMAGASERRSGRARVAPSRLVSDDMGDPFLDPPVGRMFLIHSCCFGAVGDVLLRLPGCREGTGQPRYRMIPSSRPDLHSAEYPSAVGLRQYCDEVVLGGLSRVMQRVVLELLDDPPSDHLWVRAPRRGYVLFRPLDGARLPINLSPCRLPSRSLHDIIYDNPLIPALSLGEGHYQYRAVSLWNLGERLPTDCVHYGGAASVLQRYWAQEYPELVMADWLEMVRTLVPPPGLHSRLVKGGRGMLPTIPSSLVYHPILLAGMRYLSIYSYLELFGILFDDPLAVYLISQSLVSDAACRRSLSTLCQGISGHSLSSLIGTIAKKSPISHLRHWLVATSFSGGCTVTALLRRIRKPHTLVAASESVGHHRAAHSAVHPGLEVFAGCVSERCVVDDIPEHHLRVAGFPCVNYSHLKRNLSESELSQGLKDFDYFIDSLRAFPPPVVLLENVPSLLEGGLERVLSHVEDALGALAAGRYAIFRDIVCCGDLGARMARARVFWLLYLT